MYASQTNYQSLYAPSYFGKSPGIASFSVDAFTQSLIDFCRQRKLRHIVDIGSGSGVLAATLRQAGFNVLTCDFDPVSAEGIHFDLAGSADDAQKVLTAVQHATGSEPWLVTCLDVLEHIDIEDVASAVQNLRTVCHGLLLTSISTRPSSADNKYHATLLPKATWIEILRSAAFDIEVESIFEEARTVRKDVPDTDDLRLVSYWARMDPFRDVELGEPDYVLAVAHESVRPDVEVREHIEEMLDVAYLRAKRKQFDLERIPRLGLNIHHPQDFILLKPLLEVLPRGDVVALIRRDMLRADELALVRGTFERCGVEGIFFDRCLEIPWQALALQYLLSPAESNVATNHVLSRQIVEAAKLNGVYTLQLQHGVWIEPFAERAITFGSDTILSWGPSYERLVSGREVALAGSRARKPPMRDGQCFEAIGGAKFVDLRLMPSKQLARWRLGLQPERFRAVALLGTNLRWQRHGTDREDVYLRLCRMVQMTPDVLFIIKVHPSERASDADVLRGPNTLVLDDILLGVMGLGINRVVAAVDVVISSLSTLLLDAAVAGKPCIQYDTRNALAYDGVRPVTIEQIPQLLQHLADLPVHRQLVDAYAESAHEPFYSRFAALLQTPRKPHSEAALDAAASFYSVAHDVEDLWFATSELQEQLSRSNAASAEQRESLVQHQEALVQHQEALVQHQEALQQANAEVEAARAMALEASQATVAARDREATALENAEEARRTVLAIQGTVSWRFTAPLRVMRRLFSRSSGRHRKLP